MTATPAPTWADSAARGYTAVVHYPAPRGGAGTRDAAAEALLRTAETEPGHRGSTVLRGGSAAAPELSLILSFDSHLAWQRWESSEPARRAIARLDQATGAPGDGHLVAGMAGWFDLPGQAGAAEPPRWKSAVVSFVALVPLLYVIQAVLAPFTTGLAPDVAGLLNAVIMIALATYLVLPLMTRLLRRWLYPYTHSALTETFPEPR